MSVHLFTSEIEMADAVVVSKPSGEGFKVVLIQCPKCKAIVKIKLAASIGETIEYFPFPVIAMHTGGDASHPEVHNLVAYIDKQLQCRHAEYLDGSRVFITPYILYNPHLLRVFCWK